VTICLVTDRRRFDPPVEGLLRVVRDAVAAGVDLVQVRERDLEAVELSALVRQVLAIARGTATRVVVNDRLDVALACAADGVHLRADSFPVSAARTMAPSGFLVGRSVHTSSEAHAAAEADYLIAGTVYSTRSKPDSGAWLGAGRLQAIVRATRAPVLAIGGVTPGAVREVASTGAAGIAGIGMFVHGFSAATVAEMRRQFDTATPAP
jgi:thiamine-phosphate pyrophosphorylase